MIVNEEVINEILDVLKKHDVVDDHALRDFQIRKRYKDLRAIIDADGSKKYSCKQVRKIVSNEFCISEKRIEAIIYH